MALSAAERGTIVLATLHTNNAPTAVDGTHDHPVVGTEDEEGNRTSPGWRVGVPHFVVRTAGNPTPLIDPIRRRILEFDRNLPIASVQSLDEIVDAAKAQQSFTMLLLLVGSAGALLIGAQPAAAFFNAPALPPLLWVIAVSINPGATAFTVMLRLAYSRATVFVKPITAALDAA